MNYRHAFHAGNFADLLKHTVLLELLGVLTRSGPPLQVLDTHAGAGIYDLQGESARRTGEADAGIAKLMSSTDVPGSFAALIGAVRRANAPGSLRYYLGSPLLIAGALRSADSYLGCELHPEEVHALQVTLARAGGAQVLASDGWNLAADHLAGPPNRTLILVDPPYEQPDDLARAARLIGQCIRRDPAVVIVVWVPIKDLASFDAFRCDAEDAAADATVLTAQVRLRPLTDPMRLNGCAVLIVNPPPGMAAFSLPVVHWIAKVLGAAGSSARVD